MKKKILKNQRGQGLIEYVILVAIIGVGSIVLVRSVGQNLNVKFGQIVAALGGSVEKGAMQADRLDSNDFKRKDLRNFMKGATSSRASDSNDSEKEEP